jgi:hypothetical protein
MGIYYTFTINPLLILGEILSETLLLLGQTGSLFAQFCGLKRWLLGLSFYLPKISFLALPFFKVIPAQSLTPFFLLGHLLPGV